MNINGLISTKTALLALFTLASALCQSATIWNHKENLPGVARHRTTGFALGNKGYIGLGHYNSGPLGNVVMGDFWQYDPASDSWTQVADFGGGLRYHAADFTYDNKGYVSGGRDDFGFHYNDLWEYDPMLNSWSEMAPLPSYPRRAAVGFTLGEYGIIGTGELDGAPTFYGNDIWAYHVPTGVWYAGPDLPGAERGSAVGFAIGNRGFIGTGSTLMGATNDFYELKLSPTATWTVRPVVGPTPRQEAYGFALNGTGYILTGDNFSSGINYGDMWEYDTTTNTWTQIPDFPGIARRYLDGFEIDGKAYMGMGTNGTNFKDLWEFNPENALGAVETNDYDFFTYQSGSFQFFNLGEAPSPKTELSIYSLHGELVYQETVSEQIVGVNIEQFKSGIYLYVLNGKSSMFFTGKFVVNH